MCKDADQDKPRIELEVHSNLLIGTCDSANIDG